MKGFIFLPLIKKEKTHNKTIKHLSIGAHSVYSEEFTAGQLEQPFEIAIKDTAASAL